jgi:hypothetical protein
MKENNHIAFQKLKESNLWLVRNLNINNTIVPEPIQTAKVSLSRLISDLVFERRGQQLSIFLSSEFYDSEL